MFSMYIILFAYGFNESLVIYIEREKERERAKAENNNSSLLHRQLVYTYIYHGVNISRLVTYYRTG